MEPSGCAPRVAKTIAPVIATITSVRRKVAKFELIPATPILAKIAVRAAKSADNKAKTSQLWFGDVT